MNLTLSKKKLSSCPVPSESDNGSKVQETQPMNTVCLKTVFSLRLSIASLAGTESCLSHGALLFAWRTVLQFYDSHHPSRLKYSPCPLFFRPEVLTGCPKEPLWPGIYGIRVPNLVLD